MLPSGILSVFSSSFKTIVDAPLTQQIPIPRATTAAWLVMPPRIVKTPLLEFIPSISSGDVSSLTSNESIPFFLFSITSLAVK